MSGKYGIIYEDEYLLVVDKPSGLLTIPTPKNEANTLTDIINRDLDRRGVEVNAYPCHRLDRETSGIIVYAKGKKMQKAMMDAFKTRSVKKKYLAFLHGVVQKNFDIVKVPIYNRNKSRVDPAETRYKVVRRERDLTVVEAEPVTGRTNQIRIHMKHIGHPLVGESVYAFRKDHALKFKRVALHAAAIAFIHPATKRELEFVSPLPADMAGLLS